MPNIVLCCDGTSNEFARDNTNVVKLCQMLVRDPDRQLLFYDPGVGTMGSPAALLPISKRVTRVLGLAIGLGLTKNVEDAYVYLMNHWHPGDSVFIFGFSRGAYTARVTAGMLHRCGLLAPGQEQLVPYASRIYRRVDWGSWRIADEFGATFTRPCPVRFLGLWDTVSSVGWVWDPKAYPFTRNNASVQTVRHAVAIDERRAFFRQNLWGEGDDVKQVWFAGTHCDVGGSYPSAKSGLSQIALEWMVTEAESAGLLLDPLKRQSILSSSPPDHRAPANESLRGWWRLAEFYPKQVRKPIEAADGTERWEVTHRMNRGRPRPVEKMSLIHESVLMRMRDCAYRPKSLGSPAEVPTRFGVEPWAQRP